MIGPGLGPADSTVVGPAAVALAGRGAVDDPSLLRAFESVRGRARVVRRCADLAELLACAATGTVDAAVVAASLRRLDRDAVASLHRQGVPVVVVCDVASDVTGWLACGAAAAVVGDDPSAVVEAAVAAVASARPATPAPRGPAGSVDGGPGAEAPSAPGSGAGPDARTGMPRGRVVAVWGPVGAPGRTTVALALADELARCGRSTLLVDADTYGAAVGMHLGLLDDTSGLAAVTRLAALARLDEGALHRASVSITGGLRVLTGLARATRWPELRPASVQAVLELAARCFDTVVVDVAAGLGAGVAAGSGVGPPDRDDATRAVLAVCDVLVAVGTGDAIGLVRLARELEAATDLAPAARRCVVVNRVRRSSLGPRPQRQVAEVLGQQVAPGTLLTLPDDPDACDAAVLQGRTLAEVAPDSPLRDAVGRLATEVEPAVATPRRRSGRLGRRRSGSRPAGEPRRVLHRAG